MTKSLEALIAGIKKTLKNVRNEQWEYRKLGGDHQVIVKGSLKTGPGWRQYSHITNEVDEIGEAKYIAAANPENVSTLIAALEQAEKYAKERDLENQDLMLTIGRLRVEREAANKRIAELEASRLSVESLPKSENFWSAVADITDQSETRHSFATWNVQLGRSDAKALSEWLLSVLPLLGTEEVVIPLYAAPQLPAEIQITDDMALAFHHALTDGSIGHDDLEEIKTGLRAALVNIVPLASEKADG